MQVWLSGTTAPSRNLPWRRRDCTCRPLAGRRVGWGHHRNSAADVSAPGEHANVIDIEATTANFVWASGSPAFAVADPETDRQIERLVRERLHRKLKPVDAIDAPGDFVFTPLHSDDVKALWTDRRPGRNRCNRGQRPRIAPMIGEESFRAVRCQSHSSRRWMGCRRSVSAIAGKAAPCRVRRGMRNRISRRP